MVKKRRNALILIGVAAVVVVSLIVSQGIERKDRTDVTVDRVEKGTIVAKISGPGRVRAETKVQISSSIMGRIVDLAVDEGDQVEQGTAPAEARGRLLPLAGRAGESAGSRVPEGSSRPPHATSRRRGAVREGA